MIKHDIEDIIGVAMGRDVATYDASWFIPHPSISCMWLAKDKRENDFSHSNPKYKNKLKICFEI